MTTPISRGHPDWGRTVSAAEIKVLFVSETQNPLVVDRGRFFVGNLPYLHIVNAPNAGGMRVTLDWFETDVSATLVSRRKVDALPAALAEGAFANPAPWVKIVTTGSIADVIAFVGVYQTLAPHFGGRTDDGNILISVDGVSVAAGATRTDNATLTSWGWGFWTARLESAASMRARLLAVDYLGATKLLGYTDQNGASRGEAVLLPSRPVRIVTFNGDGVARNLFAAAISHSGPT